ncbi:hypothetical protein ACFQ10_39300 [Streptomyces indonesiensis]
MFSPDRRTLASESDGNVQLRDVATGRLRTTLWDVDYVTPLAFSPDGRTVAMRRRHDRGVVGRGDGQAPHHLHRAHR